MTREEAIRILASSCISGSKQTEALETLIPELRESEDERIRKEILDFVLYKPKGSPTDEEQDRWVAWLEKQKDLTTENIYKHSRERMSFWNGQQKEQKPADLSEMMIHKEPYIAPVPTPMVADEQKPAKPSGKLSRQDYLYQLLIDQLITYSDYEYLIGHKPAEWSDTDNIGWDEAFACVTRAEKSAKNEEELQNAVTAEKWLKEIKFKYCVHPVKQEWSEEDEKMRINILNALTPQLVYSVGKGTYTGTSTYKYDDEIRWLKSLRPSWKPSKEQMNGLAHAINLDVYDAQRYKLDTLY